MVKFLYVSAMNTFIDSWFCNLALSSGIHLKLNMDMFAASDLEGIGECAVHFFIISPAPT